MNKHTQKLIDSIKESINELMIQFTYWNCFNHYYSEIIKPEDNSDGILISSEISTLMETKFKLNLNIAKNISIVLIQVLFYLKRRELKGSILPKSIFVGSNNECFCLPVNSDLTNYLKLNIDWTIAASEASAKYPEISKKLSEDGKIVPYIFTVNENFNFDDVIEKLKNYELNEDNPISITEQNIILVFKNFANQKIVTDPSFYQDEDKNKMLTFDDKKTFKNKVQNMRKLADLFTDCLTSDKTFLDPDKKNTLINNAKIVKVNSNKFKTFFSHYKLNYTPTELVQLVANKDKIFEEIYKRETGTFFTPKIWVDEAHKAISEVYGENWRNEYAVWDCSAGTANLTRDYEFKELYISTLEQADINTINDMNYNPNSIKFPYDFLNEYGIDSVPEKLKNIIMNKKKLLIPINPPYGRSGGETMGCVNKNSVDNIINKEMKNKNLRISSNQLFMQFIYKICKLKEINNNIVLVIFCPPFINIPSFLNFQTFFTKRFNNLKGGFFMRSNNFSEVDFGVINLTIWE